MIIRQPEPEHIPQLRSLWKQAFEDTDAFLDKFFSAGFAPERCHCVMDRGQVAAALYWFNCRCGGRPLAYIYAVATGKAFRGQGLCRRLMADTQEHLKDKGYAGALLVPGDPGLRRMYRDMGYEDMTGIRRFSCTAGVPVSLEAIDAARYAALRREKLPGNAVLQEGENLRFLEIMAQFYVGEGILLCAVKDGDRLTIPELLGDPAAAPGIVAALGCKEGVFSVPGEDEPFAMGIALTPDFRKPSHFAFAFD